MQQNIGYCPQFDALIERLTGREMLTMFARLRGIRESCISSTVDEKLELLNLRLHADKQCWKYRYNNANSIILYTIIIFQYSGGNRRKLSAAIALIGEPKVILMDEPTTGMDIQTKKAFIHTLRKIVQQEKRSIVITSHRYVCIL